jgi:hypothetical protein
MKKAIGFSALFLKSLRLRKIIALFVLSVCLFSCASWRFMAADPKADPSVYFKYSLHDVLSVNIAGENAFKGDSSSKYFHIVSDVYLRYDENQHIVLSDNEGNPKRIIDEGNFNDEYYISKNGDYDSNKIYRVKYTLHWNNSSYSAEHLSIKIDSIEGWTCPR